MHRLSLHIAFLAMVMFCGSVSWGQLNKAYEENWKDLSSQAEELAKFNDADQAKREFDRIKSLAERIVDRAGRVADALNGIGSKCNEQANRDALSAIKSRTVDAAKKVKDKAERLRSRADSKADCLTEIRDLGAAIKESLDSLNDARKAHDQLADRLHEERVKAALKWWEMTKDDRKDLDEGCARWIEAMTQADRLKKRLEEATKAYAGMCIEERKAQAKLSEMTRDTEHYLIEEVVSQDVRAKNLQEDRQSKWKDVAAIRKEVEEAEATLKKLFEENQKANEAYAKEVDESDTFLIREVKRTYELKRDFANEYKKQ